MKKLLLILPLLILITALAGCVSPQKETITVGSKDYSEQDILGNMLVLLIEAHTDLTVIHMDNMVSHVIFPAITTGALDVYVEYTGTIYGNFFNLSDTNDATEIFNTSAALLNEMYDVRMLGKIGFNNSFGLAVRQDTAQQYGLRTFSDLAEVSSNMIFCGSAGIISRNDGLPNLKRLYNMSFLEEIVLHNEERYIALINDYAQVAEVFTTDGLLFEHDVVVLEDDKNFFPPYHAVVIARNEILEKHPELINVLELLTNRISDDVMRALNHRVDVGNETPREVAESFLRANGLI